MSTSNDGFMSFKKFIGEMTMKAGNLDADLIRIFDYYKKSIKDDELKHIGDIGSEIKVMRYESGKSSVDFLMKGSDRIGFSVGKRIQTNIGELLELDDLYIIPEQQRKDLGFKYLYFLKNVLKQKILFGKVHSRATQEFLKKQHNLKRFDLRWYNLKTDEKDHFDKDKYDLSKPTDWRVLIEADENQMFEQFYSGIPALNNSYEWLFEECK